MGEAVTDYLYANTQIVTVVYGFYFFYENCCFILSSD